MSKLNLCDFILFGGYGDLSFRKLIPALYHLCNEEYVTKDSRIIIVSRKDFSFQEHIEIVKNKLKEFLPKKQFIEEYFEEFQKQLFFVKVDFNDIDSYKNLKVLLNEYKHRDRINYLSTSPNFFGTISHGLNECSLITSTTRIVLEKPLGKDLNSSKEINYKVLKYFNEDQIYRIDHYLGKDTVQNILALRFSNRIFVPLWSSNHIDHIQITVSESVGVENRDDYYDEYGALRDMIQNHLMQLLCLIAMEPPCNLDSNSIRDEKVKVIRSLRRIKSSDVALNTVRAQYTKGYNEGKEVDGYKEDINKQNSDTETFAAIKVDINNWRWHDVPFYIRTGKRMQRRNSEIVIQFKAVPHSIFEQSDNLIHENKLVITLQPNECIELKLMNKIPGLSNTMKLQEVNLDLNSEYNVDRKSDAYERLILDVIKKNSTLFMRLDEVEEAWKWTDEILDAWKKNMSDLKFYSAGSQGPSAAVQLIAKDGRSWNDE